MRYLEQSPGPGFEISNLNMNQLRIFNHLGAISLLKLSIFLSTVVPFQVQAVDVLKVNSCAQALIGSTQHPRLGKPNLVSKNDPALREKAIEVLPQEIDSKEIKKVILNLRSEMKRVGGVAIAAPQLGSLLRLIVVQDRNVFGSEKDVVLINPRLDFLTDQTEWGIEGCLSIPGVCGYVKRFTSVKVKYLDEQGQHQEREVKGYVARVLQHEVDHLDGILFTDKTLFKELKSKKLIESERKFLDKPAQKITTLIDKSIQEAHDPYSLSHDVLKLHPDILSFKNDVETLLRIFIDLPAKDDRSRALNEWARTEEHALWLYDLLSRTGLNNFVEELNYLHSNNVNFIESRKSGNSLVTYAFEKEGSTADITLLYRPPRYPEAEWLQKTESERMKLIQKLYVAKKTFLKAQTVMPTDLKPAAVGGYSVELSDSQRKGYGWEISHKKYEINRQRLMRTIRELAQLFKQTHSFQVHLVFELPKKYVRYENFIYWFKHLNDYLYLKGLEEGLHGNYLTGVANIPSDLSIFDRAKSAFRFLHTTPNTIEMVQSSLGWVNAKFFSAGLRAGKYGLASSDESMKIGIELRDTTRNIDLLDQFTNKISQSLENRAWEKVDLQSQQKQTLRLTTDKNQALQHLSKIVSMKYAVLFASIENTAHFGLMPFEGSQVLDYQTHRWKQIPQEVRQRIEKAREEYEKDLVDLEKELEALSAQGEKTETDLIKSAIRMSLATWAKKARVAEMYQSY